jgi:histone acetyltransferase (RNA polymerase elongator complex component)
MTPKTTIYPIFLLHAGCPFQCVYCNQHAVISADSQSSLLFSFREQLSRLTKNIQRNALPGEIAFYGGTFTALPIHVLQNILDTVSPWVQDGKFTSIRFSTRPDTITSTICSFLEKYPVATVELGVQSFSNEVLLKIRRGYTSETVYRAIALIKEKGWALGLQLMVGLPGDTQQRFLESVSKAIASQPSFVRLYPTLVLKKTLLAQWYQQGFYDPLDLEKTITWCVAAYDACLRANIPVARLGLHADPQLEEPGTILAGPYHPALGYLVRVRWWRDRIDQAIGRSRPISGQLILRVPKRSTSEVLGPHRSNLTYWKHKYHLKTIQVKGETGWPPGHFECIHGKSEE